MKKPSERIKELEGIMLRNYAIIAYLDEQYEAKEKHVCTKECKILCPENEEESEKKCIIALCTLRHNHEGGCFNANKQYEEDEEKLVKCDRCSQIKPLGRVLKFDEDPSYARGLCVQCSKENYDKEKLSSSFNPSEEDLLRIARESSCLQRIQLIVADYIRAPKMMSSVDMADEIFKDVERTLKGSEVKDTFPPLTAKEIVERCGNKVAGGKLLYDTHWYEKEDFFTTEKCRPISMDFAELQHTGKNWNECKELGEMFNFAEVVYLLSTSEEFRKMLTAWDYTWTNSRSSDGRLVRVGCFATDGAIVLRADPRRGIGHLGVSFSRSA